MADDAKTLADYGITQSEAVLIFKDLGPQVCLGIHMQTLTMLGIGGMGDGKVVGCLMTCA